MRNAPGWPSAEREIYTHPWIFRQLEHIEVYHDQEAIGPTPAGRSGIEDRNKLVEDWLDSFVRSTNAAPASQMVLKQRKEHLSLVSRPQLSPQQALHPYEATRNTPSIPYLTSVLPLQTLSILLWARHQIGFFFSREFLREFLFMQFDSPRREKRRGGEGKLMQNKSRRLVKEK